MNNRKIKNLHTPPNEESHPVTGILGETVEETEELITTKQTQESCSDF